MRWGQSRAELEVGYLWFLESVVIPPFPTSLFLCLHFASVSPLFLVTFLRFLILASLLPPSFFFLLFALGLFAMNEHSI